MGNEYIDGRLRSADKAYRHMATILALLALLCALPLACLFDSSWASDSKLGVALTATALTALASIAMDFLFAIRHAHDERICEIDTFGWLLELAGWYAVRPDTPACAEKTALAGRLEHPEADGARDALADLAKRLDDMTGEHYTDAWRGVADLYAANVGERAGMNRLYRIVMAKVAENPTADRLDIHVDGSELK